MTASGWGFEWRRKGSCEPLAFDQAAAGHICRSGRLLLSQRAARGVAIADVPCSQLHVSQEEFDGRCALAPEGIAEFAEHRTYALPDGNRYEWPRFRMLAGISRAELLHRLFFSWPRAHAA